MVTKAKKEKVENYTAAQYAAIKADYLAATDDAGRKAAISEHATLLKKSERSIISKLSREKDYKRPEKATKAGDPVMSKESLLARICSVVESQGGNPATFDGLDKAPKNAMFGILYLLNEVADLRGQVAVFEEVSGMTGEEAIDKLERDETGKVQPDEVAA